MRKLNPADPPSPQFSFLVRTLKLGLVGLISFILSTSLSRAEDAPREERLAEEATRGLAGSWFGTLDLGAFKLRLEIEVVKTAEGNYRAVLDSLDQGSSLELDSITLRGDEVRFESAIAGFAFEGVLTKKASEITGKFGQSGLLLPLTLRRGTHADDPSSKPDYSAPADAPYTAEEVVVQTPAGFTLAGTLTLPRGASREKPVGAIVTVTGSGPQERDGFLQLEGYRPFRQFADSLARRGIATLRMDDRGIGSSGGKFQGATTADFAEDVRAGLAYLQTRPEIRPDRLGVLGHSEGALVAPMVAVKESSLAALVLLAGLAEPARSALHFQMKNTYRRAPGLTEAEREARIAGIPEEIDGMMAKDPWLRFLLKHDPAPVLRRVKAPVLILTGANDQQSPPEQVALQAAALKSGGNRDVTARVLPGVNHLLVEDEDGFPVNYVKLEPPVVVQEKVLEIVADWLVQRLHRD